MAPSPAKPKIAAAKKDRRDDSLSLRGAMKGALVGAGVGAAGSEAISAAEAEFRVRKALGKRKGFAGFSPAALKHLVRRGLRKKRLMPAVAASTVAGAGIGSLKREKSSMHTKKASEREAARRGLKTASIAEYSVLFDKAASGELGEGTRQALYGVCQAIEAPIAAEKSASVYDASNLSEEDARKARLDQLLKR